MDSEPLPDLYYQGLLLKLNRIINVPEGKVDLETKEARSLVKEFKPLADLVASSGKFKEQNEAMFTGFGESSEDVRGVASKSGLALEEKFKHKGTVFMRSIYWTPEMPEVVEVYSVESSGESSGFGSKSPVFLVPLDGDMSKLKVKAPES